MAAELCYQCDGEGFTPVVNGHGGGNCPRCGGGGKERAVPLRYERFRKFLTAPWQHDGHGGFIFDGDSNPIAEVRGWGSLTGTGGHRLSDDTAVEVQQARGDLIASAPDLYTALDGMVSACEDLYKSGRLDASAWLTARAALAKARGEN